MNEAHKYYYQKAQTEKVEIEIKLSSFKQEITRLQAKKSTKEIEDKICVLTHKINQLQTELKHKTKYITDNMQCPNFK